MTSRTKPQKISRLAGEQVRPSDCKQLERRQSLQRGPNAPALDPPSLSRAVYHKGFLDVNANHAVGRSESARVRAGVQPPKRTCLSRRLKTPNWPRLSISMNVDAIPGGLRKFISRLIGQSIKYSMSLSRM